MARVQWRRARFDTVAHAVIEGDVLVLCGAMTRKGPRPAEDFGHIVAPEAVPGMACPYCREIITEAAEALGVGSHGTTCDHRNVHFERSVCGLCEDQEKWCPDCRESFCGCEGRVLPDHV